MENKLKEKNINSNNGLENKEISSDKNKEISSDNNSLQETELETKTENI